MENLDPNLIFLWRAMERFANVLIGALSIYLGYKLFMNLPEKREEEKGEMKLMLPGDISVYVSRVGPGIFFGLFGTSIVLMSFVSSLELSTGHAVIDKEQPAMTKVSEKQKLEVAALENKQRVTVLSYVSGNVDVERFSVDRSGVKRDMLALREMEDSLNTYLETQTGNGPVVAVNDAGTLLNTMLRVKRSLLLSVWDDDWGDAQMFSQWVQDGALEPPPDSIRAAAEIFNGLK